MTSDTRTRPAPDHGARLLWSFTLGTVLLAIAVLAAPVGLALRLVVLAELGVAVVLVQRTGPRTSRARIALLAIVFAVALAVTGLVTGLGSIASAVAAIAFAAMAYGAASTVRRTRRRAAGL